MSTTGANEKVSASISEGGYEKYVRKIVDLPTIPQILMRIWKILDSPDSSSADLEKVISLDQALSAKVIRLANSPFYNTLYRVSNVKNAIVNIGFDAVKNMVIAVSVTSIFKKQKGANRYFPLRDFWRHCVGVGATSHALAAMVDGLNPETCLCAGILHDIGKFALNLVFPQEFGTALRIAAKEKITVREAEERVFSADHSLFGRVFAEHWNFSEELRGIIGSHHKPLDEVEEKYLIEVAVIKAADIIVRKLHYGFPGDFVIGPVDERLFDLFDAPSDFLDSFKDEARKAMKSAGEFLNLL
jgi:putative nucleotidyltransferase with HDIG domain